MGTLTENPEFSDTQESVFILKSIRSCSDKQQYQQERAGEGEDRGWDGWVASPGLTSMDMSLSKLREMVKGREAWPVAVHRVAKNQIQLSDLTTTTQPTTKTISELVLGALPCSKHHIHFHTHPTTTLWDKDTHYSHFTDDKTKAQRG